MARVAATNYFTWKAAGGTDLFPSISCAIVLIVAIGAMISVVEIGQPIRYESRPPEEFLRNAHAVFGLSQSSATSAPPT